VQNCYYALISTKARLDIYRCSICSTIAQRLPFGVGLTSMITGWTTHRTKVTSFPKRDQLAAAGFAAKSVAAVAKSAGAAGFISKYGKLPGTKQKAKKANY
jgi:hypothetical protein